MWCLNRLALPPVKVALTVLFWGCCAVLSHSVLASSLQPHELQPARLLSPRGFSRHEYWCGFPCSLPGDLPDPGIEPRSPTLQADSLLSGHWEAHLGGGWCRSNALMSPTDFPFSVSLQSVSFNTVASRPSSQQLFLDLTLCAGHQPDYFLFKT